ncbi:MAG: hypothetical protein RMK64_00150 [Rhodovarius sp.]|nr:hypothetical protein [Rhodovarius sp.]MDW8313353.1 hypothetical protein [Rhodovarius sp.]
MQDPLALATGVLPRLFLALALACLLGVGCLWAMGWLDAEAS